MNTCVEVASSSFPMLWLSLTPLFYPKSFYLNFIYGAKVERLIQSAQMFGLFSDKNRRFVDLYQFCLRTQRYFQPFLSKDRNG